MHTLKDAFVCLLGCVYIEYRIQKFKILKVFFEARTSYTDHGDRLTPVPVSYTHLDVYKRQYKYCVYTISYFIVKYNGLTVALGIYVHFILFLPFMRH